MSDFAIASASMAAALGGAASRLARAGCQTPRLDAELLLCAVLGVERSRLVLDAGERLDADALARFEELTARRAAREPVAYITGRRWFRRLELHVDRRVLIPRPETELLVEVGLTLPTGVRVADVGTGSGAVALALKDERPDLSVIGVDASTEAIAVARDNADRLGLEVEFAVADLLKGVGCDAVLANLPYVVEGTVLDPEIERYEPAGALFAGSDGLELIRRLVPMLGPVSVVALEVGPEQAGAVQELLMGAGFGTPQRLHDLAGHQRVVLGRR